MRIKTEYVKIYDAFYNVIATREGYEISDNKKSEIVDAILSDLPWQDSIAIKASVRYRSYDTASKITGVSKKQLIRQYDIARRHMYAPANIDLAVPTYFKLDEDHSKYKFLDKSDFGGKKYIVTALNKSKIYTKEQLIKYLDNGWFFLWCIPGCGDAARINILTTIDRWSGKKKLTFNLMEEGFQY